MNDLKLLISTEKQFQSKHLIELVAFDLNMNTVYVTDHKQIYKIGDFEV